MIRDLVWGAMYCVQASEVQFPIDRFTVTAIQGATIVLHIVNIIPHIWVNNIVEFFPRFTVSVVSVYGHSC